METVTAFYNGPVPKGQRPLTFRPVTIAEVMASADDWHGHPQWFIIGRNGRAYRVRHNGMVKTWKTRPGELSIPLKVGLRECFRLSHHDIIRGDLLMLVDDDKNGAAS